MLSEYVLHTDLNLWSQEIKNTTLGFSPSGIANSHSYTEIIISISIDRRYRIMYMSYLRPRHVTRIAAMRLGCILFCLRVSCVSRG